MEINQKNIMVGNFIEVMGTFQIVMGIVFREDLGNWYIQHTGNDSDQIPLPDDVEFRGYGILATDVWRKWLKVEKRKFPKHIQYVHEIQNYCLINYGIFLNDQVDFNYTPSIN